MKVFISIGYNCDPRVYIKNNLHMSKDTGYKSCPFDLCITSYEALYKCIETDFIHFFDLELIQGVNAEGNREKCGAGGMNIINSYKMIFNHEGSTHSHLFIEGENDDNYYIRDNFSEFKKRYSTRISNFRSYLKNNEIILIRRKSNDETESADKIIELFHKVYNKKVQIQEI